MDLLHHYKSTRSPIFVVADDLTGAAEIAGAAMRLGVSVEVWTEWSERNITDLVCIDTNTRSMDKSQVDANLVGWLDRIRPQPGKLFKKTDSLFRGHVRAEIDTILRQTGWPDCLLCPANPSRGRIIRNGEYYVDGRPLDATIHVLDPLNPLRTSSVRELLGAGSSNIRIPDEESLDDMNRLAQAVDRSSLPAGGTDFFVAWLSNNLRSASIQVSPPVTIPIADDLPKPIVMVCGSQAAWKSGREREASQFGWPTILLDDVAESAESATTYMMAIGDRTGVLPNQLESQLAHWVAARLQTHPVGTLLIEGGATARAIADAKGWNQFSCLGEVAPGCVALRPDEVSSPVCVLKPGSYPWPDRFWSELG